jgi:probable F420-dependent oxidoreductase
MKYAFNLPLTRIDASQYRDVAQTLDGEGFDLVTMGGHLLSAPDGRYPDRPSPNYAGQYAEPFVLFSYLAGATQRLSFMSSILILPLLPTALVAKQAAELSLLSGGRFKIGAGISWQEAEYAALGQDVHQRGRRFVEQVHLLRRFWTEPTVSFEGKFEHVDGLGIGRLPPQPVPIWMGTGTDDARLRRVARLADGWIPTGDPEEPLRRIRRYLEEAGRDPASFGLLARVAAGPEAVEGAKRLQGIGATYITVGPPQGQSAMEALPAILAAKKAIAEAIG